MEALAGSLRYVAGQDLDAAYRAEIELFCRILATALARRFDRVLDPALWGSERDEVSPALRTAADALAANGENPGATLTAVYGDLLRYQPLPDPETGHVRLVRSDQARKISGSYFTPAMVAAAAVQEALQALPRRAASMPAVFDPAMGTGVFLIEAARALSGRDVQAPARVAEQCLFGVDSDPLAVEIAILSLWLETGSDPEILRRHLCCGNMLFDDRHLPMNRFDVVVGNPPWGAKYDRERRQLMRQRFPASSAAEFDSFKLFLDLGSEQSTGSLAMVVPRAVLAQERHADVRALLLKRMAPHAGIPLENRAFPGAAAPACILVFGPKPGPSVVRCPTMKQNTAAAVPASHWTRNRFPLRAAGTLDLLHRLQRRHPVLSDLTYVYRVRDSGVNYSGADVARRVLYAAPEPDDPRDRPRYRGRNFDRYTGIVPGGWLRHDAADRLQTGEAFWADWATYNRSEKLVFRQTSDRIVATIDRTCMVMGRSVIAVTAESPASLLALLGCFNSRLLTALYRALAGEEGRVLPQVKVGTIRQLPLPSVCSSALVEQNESEQLWASLQRLAGHLLESKGQDMETLAQVDQLVYRLYELTREEIALVESESATSA